MENYTLLTTPFFRFGQCNSLSLFSLALLNPVLHVSDAFQVLIQEYKVTYRHYYLQRCLNDFDVLLKKKEITIFLWAKMITFMSLMSIAASL